MLKVVEYLDVDLVIRAILLEKFAEAVCKIIALSEFEDRLVYLLAEPYYSLSDELRCPFAWTYEPWSDISCDKGSRVLIHIERDVFVLLEE